MTFTNGLRGEVRIASRRRVHRRNSRAMFLALILGPALLWGQSSTAGSSVLTEGRRIYVERCAGCHGADAHGTGHAPELDGNRRLRTRSIQQLREVIHDGIPSAGMPALDLPAHELDSIAAWVHSLNSPAAEISLPGDVTAGKQFFFGRGQCASCHMVNGRGEPIGPDLSNTGREMTVEGIRGALLQPDAHITPGYGLVTVQLRNGQTMRGFSRNRTNFDLEMQDLQGRFHRLQEDQIAAIQDEKQPLMQPVNASPKELDDLIAYLSRLTGVKPGEPVVADAPAANGNDFAGILNPKPGDWPTYNGKVGGNRYSELTGINTNTVSHLGVKWTFPIAHFGLEVTPLVMDGIMYLSGPNQAFALDAITGARIWQYSRPRTPGLVGDASLGTNKGMAILGDKVFMVTDNAHLIALNRVTGRLVWDTMMPEEPQHYGSTVAPLVVKDMVIAGVSGGDWGIRGFVAAYKAASGEPVWRFWTVPKKGEPGSETWGPKEPTFGGGSTWLTGSYDSETDTVYWTTGNSYPDYDDRDRPGDNLYTDSILALTQVRHGRV